LSVVMLGLYGLMTAQWFNRMTHLSKLENALIQTEAPLAALNALSPSIQTNASNSAIETYADQQFNQHAIGHFISEVLLKLGLMGTVLGFILMLVPIADLKTFEPQALQILLSNMSGGMAVALYTTLTGLVTSTLMKFQYYLADSTVIRITELLQDTDD
jgi:flagellar motor component MotA